MTRFHVTFYVPTHGGKRILGQAVMTVPEIQAVTDRTNWRTCGIEVAG
jgi:hypothetical protein